MPPNPKKRKRPRRRQKLSTMELLRLLSDPITRHQLLSRRVHPSELVRLIRNISKNLLENNIQVSPQDKDRLYKQKNLIRRLAAPKLRNPRRLIVMSGGFLHAILPAVVSIASHYAGQLFNKAIRV